MNKRWLSNFCAVCVVLLIWAAILATAGCGGKGLRVDVRTTGTGINTTKDVSLSTDYQIENGFKMTRNVKTGDYEIDLGSATTKDAQMGFMTEMMRMMQGMMGMPGAPNTGGSVGAFEAGIMEGRRLQTEQFNRAAND